MASAANVAATGLWPTDWTRTEADGTVAGLTVVVEQPASSIDAASNATNVWRIIVDPPALGIHLKVGLGRRLDATVWAINRRPRESGNGPVLRVPPRLARIVLDAGASV